MKDLNEKQKDLVNAAAKTLETSGVDAATLAKVQRFISNYFSVKPTDRGCEFALKILKKPIRGTGGKTVADLVEKLDARNFQLHGNAGRKPKPEDEKTENFSVCLDAETRKALQAEADETGVTIGSICTKACKAYAGRQKWNLGDMAAVLEELNTAFQKASELQTLLRRAATTGRADEAKKFSRFTRDAGTIRAAKSIFGLDIVGEIIRKMDTDISRWIDTSKK